MPVSMAAKQERDFMRTLLSAFLITLALLSGCRSDTGDFVPNVLVDANISLNLPSYQPLNVVGGLVFVRDLGYRGIVIHRLTLDEFRVFDMACTFQPSIACHVIGLDTATNLLQCGCCESRFSLDGFPARGPASLNLRSYRSLYSPTTNTLRITN